MGASESCPVTPVSDPLLNKHLAHVSDPRSPSVGILRTPIEVVSSPGGSPMPGPTEPAAGTSRDRAPRLPTPGISHTPMKAVLNDSVDCLVKQLSEAFGAEAAPPEPMLSGVACHPEEAAAEEPAPQSPAVEADREATAAAGEEREQPPSLSAGGEASVRPARHAGPPFSAGSKPIRCKTSNKIRATSGGTGRSPLSILQDDNSPSAFAPCQVKLNERHCGRGMSGNKESSNSELEPYKLWKLGSPRPVEPGNFGKKHALGENLGERKEVTVDLSRSLKSGSCTWSDSNKENHQCPFVEN
ncbi:cell division cycle-associated protein 3 isoform X1 [Apteryx mantelli]|uniref:Cell division cycle-associated protein 3 isoform X1 n=1 Tax=Apteryx mantelli TaxID=2696672 RepID=A0ABM4F2J0_9AVES